MKAYGSEPVLLKTSPVTPAPKPPVSLIVRWRKFGIVAVTIIMIGVGLWLWHRATAASPYSAWTKTVSFALYEPTYLPKGFFIDEKSFDATSQVVTFAVSSQTGEQVVFTEQPKPDQSNIERFYKEQLTETQTFDTAIGRATTGQFEGSQLTGIESTQTWILMRAVANLSAEQLQAIAKSLEMIH